MDLVTIQIVVPNYFVNTVKQNLINLKTYQISILYTIYYYIYITILYIVYYPIGLNN